MAFVQQSTDFLLLLRDKKSKSNQALVFKCLDLKASEDLYMFLGSFGDAYFQGKFAY